MEGTVDELIYKNTKAIAAASPAVIAARLMKIKTRLVDLWPHSMIVLAFLATISWTACLGWLVLRLLSRWVD